MARRESPERNRAGASKLKTIAAIRISPVSIVTVGSRPSKSPSDGRGVAEAGPVVAASDDIAYGPFLLALRRDGSRAYADENDDPSNESKRVGGHSKQGQPILNDRQQNNPENRP